MPAPTGRRPGAARKTRLPGLSWSDETQRFLACESNTSEYRVTMAYGEDAHSRLDTSLADTSIAGLQDFSDFLLRWNFLPAPVDVRACIDGRPFAAALGRERKAA